MIKIQCVSCCNLFLGSVLEVHLETAFSITVWEFYLRQTFEEALENNRNIESNAVERKCSKKILDAKRT